MADVIVVYITHDDLEKAKNLGRALVGERLAACVNLLEAMTPIYRWKGQVREGQEVVLLLKTRASLLEELTQFVRDQHDYDCPCVVALPVTGGNAEYIDWIRQETREPA